MTDRNSPENQNLKLSKRLVTSRKKRNLKKKDIASATGLSQALIIRIEKGFCDDFKLSTVIKVCEAYQLEAKELFELLGFSFKKTEISEELEKVSKARTLIKSRPD